MTLLGAMVLWGSLTAAAHGPDALHSSDPLSRLQGLLQARPTASVAARPASRKELAARKRDITSAFSAGQYDRVIRLLEQMPAEQEPPPELLKLGVRSYLQLGRPEEAFALYARLVPAGRPENAPLLQDIAMGFLSLGARHREEHVRLTAYTALAELHRRDLVPLLEDGLLDPSIPVRARAADGMGRLSPKTVWQGLTRALDDPAPAVRIAALNAVGDAGRREVLEKVARIARAEDGAVQVFALAALVRLGKRQVLDDIIKATAEPESNTRMAAIGALDRKSVV